MGTRSTYLVTKKYGDKTMPVILFYHQFDGYPDGHPKEVAEWLSKGVVVNGLGSKQPLLVFNGCGCLAAQFVAKFKEHAGGQYLYTIDSRGNCGEDYLYEIIVDDEKFTIEFVACNSDGTEFYRGTPGGFVEKVINGEI